jgi:hypothetical protein
MDWRTPVTPQEYFPWFKVNWPKTGFITSIFVMAHLSVIVLPADPRRIAVLLAAPLHRLPAADEYAIPGNMAQFPIQLPPPKAAVLERRTWKVRPCRFPPGIYLAQPNYPINVPLTDNLLALPASSFTTVLTSSPPIPLSPSP